MKTAPDTKTYAVVYGFAEGRRNARLLEFFLGNAGYLPADKIQSADLVIAHSGGCFLLPDDLPAQNILLVNPTLWPHKKLVVSLFEKHRTEKMRFTARIRSIFYALVHPINNIRMFFGRKVANLPPIRQGTYIVRNHQDPYLSPLVAQKLAEQGYSLHELPGRHDDLWIHPKPYISLIHPS